MLRRRFLGAVAALAAAPVVKLEAEPALAVEETVANLGRFINEAYLQRPRTPFDDRIYLLNWETLHVQMPRFNAIITDLKDPYEED